MKFPEFVVVGPYAYRIVWHEGLIRPGEENLVGEIRYDVEEIGLSALETPTGRWDTLLHESLHAISRLLPENLQLSEEHVTAITPYLTSVFFQFAGYPEPLAPADDAYRLELVEKVRKNHVDHTGD